MVQIEDMDEKESENLLQGVGYGHLGLVRDTHPYVVPIHYAYDEPHIYTFTTEIIANNREVCLQVEGITDEIPGIRTATSYLTMTVTASVKAKRCA